jgi:ATP-dependent Lhr-like helicase
MKRPAPHSTISRQIKQLRKNSESNARTKHLKARAEPGEHQAINRDEALTQIESWFHQQGWKPFAFQTEAWKARLDGESGLIHVPTGAGKTYAAFMGALAQLLTKPNQRGLRILYVTPLKSVSRDIQLALERPIRELGLHFRVENRTGDTPQADRTRQKLDMPEVLVTTPESLALMLTHDSHTKQLAALETVILDEWHESLGNKRGSLLELSLTRLKALRQDLSIWALTATIANIAEAATAATGLDEARIVRAEIKRPVELDVLTPPALDAFPWAGQFGLHMVKLLIARLNPDISTLIFTNTRSQAEKWYQSILAERPEWSEIMALHHGSLESAERARVEAGLKDASLRLVVCTSSLDLGVDFEPVDRVVQISSPKGIARLMQRAGRAAHRPGATAKILCVPRQAFDLIEFAAAKDAIAEGKIEPRTPLSKPLDVLVQHLVTRALGGGFTREEILSEIRTAYSYRGITEDDLDWALGFICDGGELLQAYPAFRRVVRDYGVYRVFDTKVARLHRMSIGTIDSNALIRLKMLRGREIGQIEETFASRLKRGDRFLFGGRSLSFVQMKDLDAIVRISKGAATTSPKWGGGRLPYSQPLAHAVRQTLERLRDDTTTDLERALRPWLNEQLRLSTLPRNEEFLVELAQTREGAHFFFYPFEGQILHEALGALVAYRIARRQKATFSISTNDTGVEILCADEVDFLDREFFSPVHLESDLRAALNLSQMARSSFREIARVAGLIHPGHPSARKSARQLQASAGLIYDVLKRYEPSHPLIQAAEQDALVNQLESGRLEDTLLRITRAKWQVKVVERPTPLGFPLLVERAAAQLSTESIADRVAKIKQAMLRQESYP